MGLRDKLRGWLGSTPAVGQKSWTVQVLVGDDGFMAAQNFSGGDLYNVYTQALWTYICASRISTDMASFPGIVQTRERGTVRWVRDLNHPLNALLHRPYGQHAPNVRWDWRQQVAAGALRQELGGNQFYRAVPDGRGGLLMLGLYLVELKADVDANGYPTAYNRAGYNGDNIPVNEVVNVMHPSPSSWWEGIAPTIAAEQSMRVDYTAARRLRYDLETRVQPGVVFKVKGIFSMSPEQRENVETMLATSFEGATKAGKSMVVGDNCDIQGAPLTQVNDLPALWGLARDSVISAHQVSPPVVGVLRDAKYQTWEQALRAQYTLCIQPRLTNLYDTINSQAITPNCGEDVRLWYDEVGAPLGLAALRERAETAQVYMGLGYPANAVNERFRLEMPVYNELERPNMPAVIAGRGDVPSPPADEPPPPDTSADQQADPAVG